MHFLYVEKYKPSTSEREQWIHQFLSASASQRWCERDKFFTNEVNHRIAGVRLSLSPSIVSISFLFFEASGRKFCSKTLHIDAKVWHQVLQRPYYKLHHMVVIVKWLVPSLHSTKKEKQQYVTF